MVALMRRLVPDTLFGRLTLLLLVFVLLSHALALSLMFELLPQPPRPPGPPWPGAEGPLPGPSPMPPLGLLLDVGLRLAALVPAAWIAANWLSRPIKRLATAAQGFGRQAGAAEPVPLPEDGPQECRDASRVFNRLQARIRQQLDERDRFVAAVSHDLRTPLTRLRLRAESLTDPRQQAQFQQDVAEMDQMISATLDYLRGAAQAEPLVPLDVQALVDSIVMDQQALGHAVEWSGQAAALPAQASALKRGLCNLVDNAVRYGGSAQIRLVDSTERLCIEVHDPGPGIAPALLERVLEPFFRVEGSRNRQHGGVGLGLSITRDIARQHRGTLELRNAPGAGLVATLVLPR